MELAEQTPHDKTVLSTLPGDEVRQIMWRFSERYDFQMLVQSARQVARGVVARLVAAGGRNTHEWTKDKQELLEVFDQAGITSVFIDPEHGGYLGGPKNTAMALVAFELAWVDAGAATSSLAGNLALAPIHEKGTAEQKKYYMSRCIPGNSDKQLRGAFALTEPIPYVGVDTGVLCGKVRVSEWKEGKEPILLVEKRGRFITNMDFANFVTAAVDSDDPRIASSCMVILEEGDPGTFDRGAPTMKMVHQLSSTRDPIFSLKIPASRIIGGYSIEKDRIVPNYSHGEVIESVFRRTRVPVGLMSAAKLLSAVEPVLRYQRGRFRGGQAGVAGSPRYELGLQQKEDALHRLVDVWATGEASASLGFLAARLLDEFDPLEAWKDEHFKEQGIEGGRAKLKALKAAQGKALELIRSAKGKAVQGNGALAELSSDRMVHYLVLDALTNVSCAACKLWNTGYGANMMREAVSLMGGYGITEDCSGFLGQKWMDAQLEATYEGPESVQRRSLSVTMTNELFLAMFENWIREMRETAERRPGTGACTLATAMELWLWTLRHLLESKDADGKALYHGQRQGVSFPLADALCWLLASRSLILDLMELEEKGPSNPLLADSLEGYVNYFTDLCHVQSARAAGEVGRVAAELVFGYQRHPSWELDGASCCHDSASLDELEGIMPGIESAAYGFDVLGGDGSHPRKCGPCVRRPELEGFLRLRRKLDGCLTGSRIAKDRAALALTRVMIPEALDYPA